MFASNSSHLQEEPNYIESCFSTWLYTGNGSTQTITNGIDLSGKGGLTWIKHRTSTFNHRLYDTARGATKELYSNLTDAQTTDANGLTAFNNNGFSVGSANGVNQDTVPFVSWTFRKQPKFFDVVTYTGNGATTRSIAHALGSTPGCIIVKRTDAIGYNWYVYHRSLGTNGSYPNYMYLNTTDGEGGGFYAFFSAAPTSTDFSVGYYSGAGGAASLNVNGATYVAYVFAHNAGGFGLTGTDNVISCGSWTGSTSSVSITLGYEPQWLLVRRTDDAADWFIFDVARQMSYTNVAGLNPNAANAEILQGAGYFQPTATGFTVRNGWSTNGSNWIYIAIRRGPMKTPTTGTSVFSPITANSPTGTKLTTNFPVDLSITQERTSAGGAYWMDRLRGALSPGQTGNTPYLQSSNTGAETPTTITNGWDNTGLNVAYFGGVSAVWWNFRRAPGFFDEVCYTGTGSATTQSHNLGVAPELMIVKQRSGANYWPVYSAAIGNDYILSLDTTGAKDGPGAPQWNNTAPTASVFSLGASSGANASGGTYVAYLFASCPGVSKVGSYTGTGATQTISCGFAARFVLIKRTDSTGNWWVWDTARGMVSANDPRLSLNTTAAEVTTDDSIDPDNSGFIVNQVTATNINVSSATYTYLAIA